MLEGACPARSAQRCNRARFWGPGLLETLVADGRVLCNPELEAAGSWGRSEPAPCLEGDEHQASTKMRKGKREASLAALRVVFLVVNGL